MRQPRLWPRKNGVAAALRELERLERTRFTLDWIGDPGLRRTTGQELNKGEAPNSTGGYRTRPPVRNYGAFGEEQATLVLAYNTLWSTAPFISAGRGRASWLPRDNQGESPRQSR
jgi:hypothetical protein